MEGTCGNILDESQTIVRKVMKKKYKGKSAKEQFSLQQLAYSTVEEYDMKYIQIPKVYTYDHRSYTMDRIDTTKPIYECKSEDVEYALKELRDFCYAFESKGYFANDIECYLQPSGKIAIIDFDKCEAVVEGESRKPNPFVYEV
jgi:hypothetical protein